MLLKDRLANKKNDNFWVCPFYNHFWSLFCKLHIYLSQNWGADGHFEELNVSKSQLDQELHHKSKMLLTTVFFNFSWNFFFKNGHFSTIYGHFYAIYISIFHKTEILMVILRCLVCPNLNLIKSYDILLLKIFIFSCLKKWCKILK